MNCTLPEPHTDMAKAQRAPLILFRAPYFSADPMRFVAGHEQQSCFTYDQNRLSESDIVIFHVPDLRWAKIGETPKYPGQLWVGWSQESKINYPELADPSFLQAYDLLMTYERSADIWAPYLPPLASWERTLQSNVPQKTAAAPVVMFRSDVIDKCGRNYFAAQLMRHIAVDSYGRFLRNRRLPAPDLGQSTKLQTIAAYHFCLAFENSIAPDYVTEKIYDCLLTGVVPVYLGAPNVDEFVPAGSYISANAHGGPRGLAAYLKHLLERPDEYAKYLSWRNKPLPSGMMSMLEAVVAPPLIRLLEWARARNGSPSQR